MKHIFFLIPFLLILPISIYADSVIVDASPEIENPDKPRYFAKLENDTITNVIVADPDFVLNHMEGTWIETWIEDDNPRKRYAGIGHIYNSTINAFVPEKQYNSWILNSTTALWEAPIKKPNGDYIWDEKIPNWVKQS